MMAPLIWLTCCLSPSAGANGRGRFANRHKSYGPTGRTPVAFPSSNVVPCPWVGDLRRVPAGNTRCCRLASVLSAPSSVGHDQRCLHDAEAIRPLSDVIRSRRRLPNAPTSCFWRAEARTVTIWMTGCKPNGNCSTRRGRKFETSKAGLLASIRPRRPFRPSGFMTLIADVAH